MLIKTDKGLYCPAGDFYIDPNGAVENAVITHAHSDHARRGSDHYYCVKSGESLLKTRLGHSITVTSVPYREKFKFKDVVISFHPAGHILGSSQVRIEFNGEVWVVSGDYKRDFDPTCEPFETVKCDVFITEATFGTPSFTWDKNKNHGKDIYDWWQANASQGYNSVLYAYSLGKAQRILGGLANYAKQTVICHSATEALNLCYRTQEIKLADTTDISTIFPDAKLEGELLLVPSSFFNSDSAKIVGDRYKTAFASGWTARGGYKYDAGFTMSDHADWHDLLNTILETKAQRVYVQHRGKGALVRQLKSLGLKAFADDALIPKNPRQLAFF